MSKVQYMLGIHEPSRGEGLTVQDVVDMLMTIPAKARRNAYLTVNTVEVVGMGIGQRDQAEAHEVSVSLRLDPNDQQIL